MILLHRGLNFSAGWAGCVLPARSIDLVVFIGIECAFPFPARMDALFAHDFMLHIANGRYKDAVTLTAKRGAIADILFSAISKNSKNSRKMSSYMEIQSGINRARSCATVCTIWSVIVTMAPLLGLLGTISGMISTFSVFNIEAVEPSAIAGGGVGEAWIATAMGLCVAIIALSVHAVFFPAHREYCHGYGDVLLLLRATA